MTPVTPAPLDIRDLTCCYGETSVLDRLSLTLNTGEILGITGPVGAGMSTLIKAILLLVAPRTGRVLVFAKPHELPSSRALIAYLPEEIKTPGHLTGHDVINMTRAVHGEAKAGSSIQDLAQDLELPPESLIEPTRLYSKNEMQKLALTAVLSMDRPILLLDQPMTHLDEAARSCLIAKLRHRANNGGAVLLGSHMAHDHQDVTDRIIALDAGLPEDDAELGSDQASDRMGLGRIKDRLSA